MQKVCESPNLTYAFSSKPHDGLSRYSLLPAKMPLNSFVSSELKVYTESAKRTSAGSSEPTASLPPRRSISDKSTAATAIIGTAESKIFFFVFVFGTSVILKNHFLSVFNAISAISESQNSLSEEISLIIISPFFLIE